MVWVGPEGRDWALAQPHVRPMVFGSRELSGFVCVDPDGVATDEALADWVQRTLDYVASLPEKPSTARKPSNER